VCVCVCVFLREAFDVVCNYDFLKASVAGGSAIAKANPSPIPNPTSRILHQLNHTIIHIHSGDGLNSYLT